MEAKIGLVLVVALAIGFCDAHQGDNIFGVKYEYKGKFRYGPYYVHDQLTDPSVKPDVQRVAELVAGADDKLYLFFKFPIKELRELAEIEEPRPLETCTIQLFDKQSELCKRLSGPDGNVYLSEYCNYCIDRRLKTCSNNLFKTIVSRTLQNNRLKKSSELISSYIKYRAPEATEEDIVNEIMRPHSLIPSDRENLLRGCDYVEYFTKYYTSHLDTDGKKLAAYLKDNETKNRVIMYKRCLLIIKLAKNEELYHLRRYD